MKEDIKTVSMEFCSSHEQKWKETKGNHCLVIENEI